MPNYRRLSLLCFFLACGFGSARAQLPSEVRNAAGCYSLAVSAWSPVIGSDSASHLLPTAIRLDTIRSTFAPGWVLSPNIAYPHGQGMPPTWMLAMDTLRLAWSNGLLPTYVTLVRAGSEWTGVAIAESDDHSIPTSSLPHAHVTARRRACAPSHQ